MVRIGIVDDEADARRQISEAIERFAAEKNLEILQVYDLRKQNPPQLGAAALPPFWSGPSAILEPY